jgi:hypothetical protein
MILLTLNNIYANTKQENISAEERLSPSFEGAKGEKNPKLFRLCALLVVKITRLWRLSTPRLSPPPPIQAGKHLPEGKLRLYFFFHRTFRYTDLNIYQLN